jgi:hypothetical protein
VKAPFAVTAGPEDADRTLDPLPATIVPVMVAPDPEGPVL